MTRRREELIRFNQTVKDVTTHYQPREVLLKAAEECSELTVSVFHFLDGKDSEYDLISEIADILVVGAELREIFGPEKVDHAISWKLNRIDLIIKAEKELKKNESEA